MLWLPADPKSQARGWMSWLPTRNSFHGCHYHLGMIFITQKCWSQLFHGHKNLTLSYPASQNSCHKPLCQWCQNIITVYQSLILVLVLSGVWAGGNHWPTGLYLQSCNSRLGKWQNRSRFQLDTGYNSDWVFEGLKLWRSSGNYLVVVFKIIGNYSSSI